MSKIYSEVYSILNIMGEEYINKLPSNLYKMILKEKDEYMPQFSSINDITNENCSKEAIGMIALFHVNYWCEDDDEKNKIRNIINENKKLNDKIKEEMYSYDKLFKNKKKTYDKCITEDLVVYNETLFDKILNFIKSIFGK